jgi:hypothetical protein
MTRFDYLSSSYWVFITILLVSGNAENTEVFIEAALSLNNAYIPN